MAIIDRRPDGTAILECDWERENTYSESDGMDDDQLSRIGINIIPDEPLATTDIWTGLLHTDTFSTNMVINSVSSNNITLEQILSDIEELKERLRRLEENGQNSP